MKKLLVFLLVAACLIFTAAAKETVIYENDFSKNNLSDFTVFDNMVVQGGVLKAVQGNSRRSSAYITYTLPEEHAGKAFVAEVDYINHGGKGAMLVGATTTQSTPFFSGYSCTLDGNGKYAAFGYFDSTGKEQMFENMLPDFSSIPDLHFKVKVQYKVLTFSIYKLGEDTPLYANRYDIATERNQSIYTDFTSTVGVRQYFSDKGHFDNFKVSIIEDDILPEMSKAVKLGDTAFVSNGISVSGGTAQGNGVMLTESALSGNYRVSFDLAAENLTRVYFGMTDEKNGYAFEINEKETAVFLYKIVDGKYQWLGEKENIIRSDFTTVTVDVCDEVAAVYYDNFYQKGEEFPKFEFYLDKLDGKFGIWLEGGKVKNFTVGESTAAKPAETYINPINPGADPDCLFYNGTYYLYVFNTSHDGKEVFKVYTSPDLVSFTERNVVFTWDDKYTAAQGGTSFSPNVSYNEHDGLFYLFFAAVRADSNNRSVFYATSKSPLGPFTHEGTLEPVNDPSRVFHEIDGHPFYDDDGRIYMSFSRSEHDGGGVHVVEVEMKDGKVTAKPETDTCVLVPDREWDSDGIWTLCEGGFIWKHEGYYYMIYATASYSRHYGEAYAVAENPLGPYTKYEYGQVLNYNYELDGPGDALIIPSPDGKELYMIYHRHFSLDKVDQRQTCVDRIAFVDNPDGGPDILTVYGPTSTHQPLPSNVYRYDVDRDGQVGLKDVFTVVSKITTKVAEYSGYYDVDANGRINLQDAMQVVRETVK